MSRPVKREEPITALDRAFEELAPCSPAARRVYCSANVLAIAMRTLASEWEASSEKALQQRAPGLIAAAMKWEHEAATLMQEVAK